MKHKITLAVLLFKFSSVHCDFDVSAHLTSWWTSFSNLLSGLMVSSEQKILGAARLEYNSTNPYRTEPSVVRTGTSLALEEQLFLQKRQPLVTDSLRRHFGISRPLKVAICGSGGGYRAMIYTLGALIGAQNIGLLDCTTYVAGLSGSTWTLGAWLAQGADLEALKDSLQQQIRLVNLTKQILPKPISDPAELEQVARNMAIKLLFKQPLSIVAIWGALIAKNVLVDSKVQRQQLTLSDQVQTINLGKYPLPIYTAVSPLPVVDQSKLQYHWFEFTPYEVGSADLQIFVPSWAFGRKYINGVARGFRVGGQVQFEPGIPFSYELGIFGSAFEVNLSEIVRDMRDQLQVKPWVNQALSLAVQATNGDDRLMPAAVRNPAYKLAGHAQADQKHLTLIDAGLAFNLPLPPFLRPERALDVIVIVDSSADVQGACELLKAQRYAQEHHLKFPKINYEGIDSRIVTVFAEMDPTVPVVIYLPMYNDRILPEIKLDPVLRNFDPQSCLTSGPCTTFNFGYSVDQFEQLCRLGQRNMELARSQISDALIQRVKRLRLK